VNHAAKARTVQRRSPHPSGGENAVAIAPPRSGVDFVDGGLPARLKAAIESLSGMDLSDVRAQTPAGGSNCVVQRKIDLQSLFGKARDAKLDKVLGFLGASDAEYETNYRDTVERDYGFRTALQGLIREPQTHTYGFLQASNLMADVRVAARITHRGNVYELERTFRGADQARDSVYKVSRGGETSVIKEGPNLAHEAAITEMVSTGHANVINMLDKEADNSKIRLEYASQGTLKDYNVDSEAKAKGLAKGIISGLNHVHSRGVVHGDVGRANVFLSGTADAPVAKIADFGESMAGAEAITYNLASDISGGVNLLRGLAQGIENAQAQNFRGALDLLQAEALRLTQKASAAKPQDARALAVEMGFAASAEEVTDEIVENVRLMLPEPGEAPTDLEIQAVRTSWNALAQHPWLS